MARCQTTKRTIIPFSMIITLTFFEQQVVLPHLTRPTDLLYLPGEKEHLASPEIRNREIGKADRLLKSEYVTRCYFLLDANWLR